MQHVVHDREKLKRKYKAFSEIREALEIRVDQLARGDDPTASIQKQKQQQPLSE